MTQLSASTIPVATMTEWLRHNAGRYGSRFAISGIPQSPAWTHDELARWCAEVGKSLSTRNVLSTTVVLVAIADGPEAFASFLAVACHAVAVPIAAHETSEEYTRILEATRAEAVLMSDRPNSTLHQLALAKDIPLFVIRPGHASNIHATAVNAACVPHRETNRSQDQHAAMLALTSGTTTMPKTVLSTHASLITSARCFAEWTGLDSTQKSLCVMPIAHMHSLIRSSLPILYAGGEVCWTPGFSPQKILHWIDAFRPTYLTMVPTFYRALLEEADRQNWRAQDGILAHLVIGSDMVDPDLVDRLAQRFHARITQFYGLSETCPFVAATPRDPSDMPYGSVGKIHPLWELRLIDDEGNLVATGSPGEICVRGGIINQISTGRSSAIDTDGFLRTGDIGRMDGNRYLFVDGRKDDRITRGGQKIFPDPVEKAVAAHPGVGKAVAFGFPDLELGQRIAVVVECPAGSTLTTAQIIEHCSQHLRSYMTPDAIVFEHDAIPRLPNGKIARKRLAEHYRDAIATANAIDVHASGPTCSPSLAKELATLFAHNLQRESCAVTDNYFDLGGNSLSAIELLLAIEGKMHVSLPPALFLRNPTPLGIGAILESRSRHSRIYSMETPGEKTGVAAICFAPGFFGNVSFAESVTSSLTTRHAVYGLHGHTDEKIPGTWHSFHDYANAVVEDIAQTVDRPICTMGYSLGAHCAFSLTHALQKHGCSAPITIIYDDAADLDRRSVGKKRNKTAKGGTAYNQWLLDATPTKPTACHIIYCRAGQNAAEYRSDPSSGWSEVATGVVMTIDLPASHINIHHKEKFTQFGHSLDDLIACCLGLPMPNPPDAQREVRYQARLAAREGRVDDEITLYQGLLAEHPDQPYWVHANLAEAYFDTGFLDKGIAAYHKAVALDPWRLSTYLRFFPALKKHDRTEEISQIIAEVTALRLDHPSVGHQVGKLLLLNGQYDEAESWVRQGLEQDPEHLKCLRLCLRLLTEAGRPEDALIIYDRLNAIDPIKFNTIYLQVASKQIAAGAHQDAIATILRYDQPDNHTWRHFDLLGTSYFKLKDTAQAQKALTSSVERRAKSPRPYCLLARILASQGDFEGARRHANKGMALAKKSSRWFSVATNLQQKLQKKIDELARHPSAATETPGQSYPPPTNI